MKFLYMIVFMLLTIVPYCPRWVYTERSLQSGLTVLEVDIATGFVVMNHTLREYVRSGAVPNLKRAEFYYNKVVFYFSHVSRL